MNETANFYARDDPDPTWRQVPILSHHIQDLPVREYNSVQLEPGRFTWRAANALGRDSCMGRLQGTSHTTEYLVPARGWTALLVPLSWKHDYIVNGHHADAGDVFLATDTNGYAGIWQQRDNLGLGFRTSRLQSEIARLAGRPGDLVNLTDGAVKLGNVIGTSFRRHILRIWDSVVANPLAERFHTIGDYDEQCLFEEAALGIMPFIFAHDPSKNTSKSDVSIVRSVHAYAKKEAQTPSLSDLCDQSGVGHSRLHDSFMAVHGMSPVRFLRRMRLTRARERLLNAERAPRSIKDVSIGLGFSNGGRFASDYRKLFGEDPSQTLSQTLARHALFE